MQTISFSSAQPGRGLAELHQQKRQVQTHFASQRTQVKFGAQQQRNGFVRFFISFWNFISGQANEAGEALDMADPIAALKNEIAGLGKQRTEQEELRDEIVGNYRLERERLSKLREKLIEEQQEAFAALDATEEAGLDAATIEALMVIADEEQADVEEVEEAIARQEKRVQTLEQRAEAAKAKDAELEDKMKEYKRQLKAAMGRVRETEQNEKLKEMDRQLDALTNETLQSTTASTLLEGIDAEFHKSEAALEGNANTSKNATEVIARRKAKEALRKSKTSDRIAELKRRREAAKAKEAGGDDRDVVAENTKS